MKKSVCVLVLATFIAALAVPALAFAGESKSVILYAVANRASASSTYRWKKANQGTYEEYGIAGCTCSIQNRSSSAYSWITRVSSYTPAGGYSYRAKTWASSMYWRLGLSSPGGMAYATGIINSYN